MRSRIYLDYAATAPLHPAAAQVIEDYLGASAAARANNSNANSLHSEGRQAFANLEAARKTLADILNVRPFELVFTGGATESDNSALFGVVAALRSAQNPVPHIITTSFEHDAIYKAAKQLEALGLARVSYVPPQKSGHVHAEDVAAAFTKETVLLSVMAAHNELGSLHDLQEFGNLAHEQGALFHTDAVQAFGKLALNLSDLPVDLASFSAHKIAGPKGIGLLYVRSHTPFKPFLVGGGQEGGQRSGTQNVCGAAAFAAVAEKLCASPASISQEARRLQLLRDKLYEALCTNPRVVASVPCEAGSNNYLPHIVNVCVSGIESETLILQADLAGFAVSGGSACSSHSLDPSRSLQEIGISRDLALCSLRLSLGWDTSESEIDAFLDFFNQLTDKF